MGFKKVNTNMLSNRSYMAVFNPNINTKKIPILSNWDFFFHESIHGFSLSPSELL